MTTSASRFSRSFAPAKLDPLLRTWLAIGALAVLYVVAGRLGLLLAHQHGNVTLIWPPSGLSVAVLLLYGRNLWPGVFLGAAIVTLWQGGDAAWPAALGVALGNTLEAWLSAFLLVHVAGFLPTFERVKDVTAFIVYAVLGGTLVSATLGVGSLWLGGSIPSSALASIWLVWWLGNVGGMIVVGPALLLARNGSPAWAVLIRRREYWVVITLAVGGSLLSFFGLVSGNASGVAAYLPFPLLAWAGTRHGSRGAVTCASAIFVIAILGTARDSGPFLEADPHGTLMSLWAFGVVIGATALMLGATTSQRERSERRLVREVRERTESDRESALLRERARILREMHDGVGGQLVTTLAMVERGRASDREIATSLRNVLDDLRLVIDSFDAGFPDVFGALGKLRVRLEPALNRSGVTLRWRVSGDSERVAIPPEHALHVVRIVQEAATNALRHARPTEIEIDVSIPEDGRDVMRIRVRDDGAGFSKGANLNGLGIRNMRGRAAAMGAELRIDSGDGTTIELCLPLSPSARS